MLGGFFIYFKATSPGIGAVGKYGMPLFMVILIITIFAFTTSDPLPGLDVQSTFFLAGFSYLAFTAGAFWLDGKRNTTSN